MPVFRKIEQPYWLVKIVNFEYWPWWMFFIPMLPLWLWFSIRMKSFVWFAASNPAIEYGGFFGESKIDILNHIPKKYKPQTLFFSGSKNKSEIPEEIESQGFVYPLILKPNIGERGGDVEIIQSRTELDVYLQEHSEPLIVQEYINYPFEFGVLYHRMPGASTGQISSVVIKEFMTVQGDGIKTVEQLLEGNARASFQLKRWLQEKGELMASIPHNGEKVQVDAIGNHCLGTKFLDANNFRTSELTQALDEMVEDYQGFNYGRFDLKCPSVEEFKKGEGLKVFELNGVSSEPGHIYDPKHSVWFAYAELWRHWRTIFKISKEQVKQGFILPSAKEVFGQGISHFRHKKSPS